MTKAIIDEDILEVTAFYGTKILYNLKLIHVNIENLQLKMNEIFMAGQNGIDKTWKQIINDELGKDIEHEELYVKVKHGGVWLTKVSAANVQLEQIPEIHERITTSIMRSLDQLIQGKPLDDDVVKIYDEEGKFD